MEEIKFVDDRQIDIMRAIDSLANLISNNKSSSEIALYRALETHQNSQNKKINEFKEQIDKNINNRFKKQEKSLKDMENRLSSDIDDIKIISEAVKACIETEYAYSDVCPTDEIAGAIKDYWDTRDWY